MARTTHALDIRAPALAFAVVHSRALRGLEAPDVTVEVHLANGLPSFTLVGLADTEVKESRERVRAAIQTSGLEFPHNKRVTVSLAPADLPKVSTKQQFKSATDTQESRSLYENQLAAVNCF